jgi:hypothetical protein
MIIDYKNFFRIFLCKDVEDLKARLAFLVLENIESKGYYEVADSWIEDKDLRKKVLEKVLKLQEDYLDQYRQLITSIEQCEDINKDYREQRESDGPGGGRLGDYAITCFIDFLQTKQEFEKAFDIYYNYPEKDEETGERKPPYSDEYIKKWLKRKFEQSKYKD